jgi:CubicO group peptidase (beta-lactamase class C family)
MNFRQVENALGQAVEEGVFPGAVALVGKNEEIVFEQAFGFRSRVPEQTTLQPDTVFDLASLTKPLATTMAIMLLVNDRKMELEDRVNRFLPPFGVFGKHPTTVRQLLTHTSGLPAWKPYYEEIVKLERSGRVDFVASREAKRHMAGLLQREKPACAPATRCLYSDLGFMVLGELVEIVSGMTLDRFCMERIYRPLGLYSTCFIDLAQARSRPPEAVMERFAPTELCPWRKKVLCGEVHDDNAYAMGGVAGHAGLFSSARDVHGLIACLSRCLRGADSFLPQGVVEEFVTRDESVEDSSFALGWDTPSAQASASGIRFSPRTVGHLGFTGTSIWWDLEKDCYVVLLSNRVHPTRKNEKIRQFRPHIHDLIMKAILS